MDGSRLVIAANRGPASFARDESGELVARRGGGGLVASLAPLVENSGATWVAAAMSPADREMAAQGPIHALGLRYICLDLEPETYRMAYDVVSNLVLWFVHHHLFDLPRQPRIDQRWHEAWEGYRAYNEAFARALADESPEGAVVLTQDYHLSMVGTHLSAKRPDLKLVHFHHTPFADPDWLAVLPETWISELLGGLSDFGACGFHSPRWEASFRRCCQEFRAKTPRTFSSGLPAAVDDLEEASRSPECMAEGAAIDDAVGDRRLIVRVDRMELSKNIIRGFLAYDELLAGRPDLRGRVVFLALCYPSRETLNEYVSYRQEVESTAAAVNERWGTSDWAPIVLHAQDNFPRSVAALQRYDVLLVNPIRDGMNLVAKEGAVLNRRDGALVLSRFAGAWDELQDAAIGINPFDVSATAGALELALDAPAAERQNRAARLRGLVRGRSLSDWLDDQLAAVGESLS